MQEATVTFQTLLGYQGAVKESDPLAQPRSTPWLSPDYLAIRLAIKQARQNLSWARAMRCFARERHGLPDSRNQ